MRPHLPNPSGPHPGNAPRRRVLGPVLLALLLAAPLLAGCLEAPTTEDRWTRVDMMSSSLSPNQVIAPGVRESIDVSTHITYRRIVTGYLVAELRVSGTLSPGSVTLDPNAERTAMAADIDRILASSSSCGRGIRAVTGWDHLIQPVEISFAAVAPATLMDTTASTPTGLFFLCYLGSGEKIELPSGAESIYVTPFNSSQYQILPVGMKLALPGPGPN
ncbi:MAG TPA: hypothetical protein VMJ70_00540 [Candidatus Sulfotelmatobacter sp.]|nr:hypothetical protein [Candidatus Sulfotelmatobacter sp.]